MQQLFLFFPSSHLLQLSRESPSRQSSFSVSISLPPQVFFLFFYFIFRQISLLRAFSNLGNGRSRVFLPITPFKSVPHFFAVLQSRVRSPPPSPRSFSSKKFVKVKTFLSAKIQLFLLRSLPTTDPCKWTLKCHRRRTLLCRVAHPSKK